MAPPLPLSRQDMHRRDGAMGEIDTVRDKLQCVERALSRRSLLMLWQSIIWHVEQMRSQASLIDGHRSTPVTSALGRTVDGLDDLLAQLDAQLTEARGETASALHHISNVVPAVRIDQYLADRYRLQAAGIDEAQLDAVLGVSLTSEVA